ncbi:hypothetical protein BDR22DRAFT_830647 [Usnea florida]
MAPGPNLLLMPLLLIHSSGTADQPHLPVPLPARSKSLILNLLQPPSKPLPLFRLTATLNHLVRSKPIPMFHLTATLNHLTRIRLPASANSPL